MTPIFQALLISLAIQIILFIPAYIWKTDKLTDLSYSATFAILSIIIFTQNIKSPEKSFLLLLILLWSFRLGSFLFIRISKWKKDKRFDGIRESFSKFLIFWLGQGLTVWIILIPTLTFFQNKISNMIYMIIGTLIWLFGFLFETMADYQKFIFKQIKKNKNKFISSGLWKYSRHPNYFGEISCWIGIYIFTFSQSTQSIINLISPIFIFIIIRYFTGIPKLEQSADKKYKKDKNYKRYKKSTNLLIPWFN